MSPIDTMLLGNSLAMQQVKQLIQQVARSSASVLVLGESGTGKELVAQAIHQTSDRNKGNYVPVNCGAIPAELLESELFGHEKGAFSGATSSKKGRFELADKGSLLLDEIGEMPLSMQVKLLRVLQEHEIDPVGSEKPRSVDVRVIAATHVDLVDRVADHKFREDLYYRLNVFPIQVPPLRERGEDVLLLWQHFAKQLAFDNDAPVSLSFSAARELMCRPWPGNCRELQNLVERTTIMYPGAKIGVEHIEPSGPTSVAELEYLDKQSELELEVAPEAATVVSTFAFPPQVQDSSSVVDFAPASLVNGTTPPSLYDPIDTNDAPMDAQQLGQLLASHVDMQAGCDLKRHLISLETQLIDKALQETDHNVSKAAQLLNVRRTTLIEKIKKLGLA